jgi:hypothetical protein
VASGAIKVRIEAHCIFPAAQWKNMRKVEDTEKREGNWRAWARVLARVPEDAVVERRVNER